MHAHEYASDDIAYAENSSVLKRRLSAKTGKEYLLAG